MNYQDNRGPDDDQPLESVSVPTGSEEKQDHHVSLEAAPTPEDVERMDRTAFTGAIGNVIDRAVEAGGFDNGLSVEIGDYSARMITSFEGGLPGAYYGQRDGRRSLTVVTPTAAVQFRTYDALAGVASEAGGDKTDTLDANYSSFAVCDFKEAGRPEYSELRVDDEENDKVRYYDVRNASHVSRPAADDDFAGYGQMLKTSAEVLFAPQ